MTYKLNDTYIETRSGPLEKFDGCASCGVEFTASSDAHRIAMCSEILDAVVAYKCSECGYVQGIPGP